MKNTDYIKSLVGKDSAGLKTELEALRREQFNLRQRHYGGRILRPDRTRADYHQGHHRHPDAHPRRQIPADHP